MTWKLFYCYFSSYIYKNRIWHLWKFFLKIIFPSYIYNYMFCIYSLDFFKKNTDPQLMIFTPSKFLSIGRNASNFEGRFWDWRSSVEFLGSLLKWVLGRDREVSVWVGTGWKCCSRKCCLVFKKKKIKKNIIWEVQIFFSSAKRRRCSKGLDEWHT